MQYVENLVKNKDQRTMILELNEQNPHRFNRSKRWNRSIITQDHLQTVPSGTTENSPPFQWWEKFPPTQFRPARDD